jgi:hypothetical protein
MVMSRDQNAGRSHNIRIDGSFFEGLDDDSLFERLEEFMHLGTNFKILFRKKSSAD